MYEVRLVRDAEKDLLKLPKKAAEKILSAIKLLANEPKPKGSKKLKGLDESCGE